MCSSPLDLSWMWTIPKKGLTMSETVPWTQCQFLRGKSTENHQSPTNQGHGGMSAQYCRKIWRHTTGCRSYFSNCTELLLYLFSLNSMGPSIWGNFLFLFFDNFFFAFFVISFLLLYLIFCFCKVNLLIYLFFFS